MHLQINGEAHSFDNVTTVETLMERLGLMPGKVAIELNLAIVPKSLLGQTPLSDGDRIEIVQFIGGG